MKQYNTQQRWMQCSRAHRSSLIMDWGIRATVCLPVEEHCFSIFVTKSMFCGTNVFFTFNFCIFNGHYVFIRKSSVSFCVEVTVIVVIPTRELSNNRRYDTCPRLTKKLKGVKKKKRKKGLLRVTKLNHAQIDYIKAWEESLREMCFVSYTISFHWFLPKSHCQNGAGAFHLSHYR